MRILIAKDIFDGCEGATKAVYRALVAASRRWATEEQVTAVRPPLPPLLKQAPQALCPFAGLHGVSIICLQKSDMPGLRPARSGSASWIVP